GRDLLFLLDGTDAVRRRDGGPETDLAPNAATEVDQDRPAGRAGRCGGRGRKDDGKGRGPAVPDAARCGRGLSAVDAGADSAASGNGDAAAEPCGHGSFGEHIGWWLITNEEETGFRTGNSNKLASQHNPVKPSQHAARFRRDDT